MLYSEAFDWSQVPVLRLFIRKSLLPVSYGRSGAYVWVPNWLNIGFALCVLVLLVNMVKGHKV